MKSSGKAIHESRLPSWSRNINFPKRYKETTSEMKVSWTRYDELPSRHIHIIFLASTTMFVMVMSQTIVPPRESLCAATDPAWVLPNVIAILPRPILMMNQNMSHHSLLLRIASSTPRKGTLNRFVVPS
jgi:hypothetical protein